jgi:hypothetical protein
VADRCQSCGRELGDIVRTTMKGHVLVVQFETVDDEGEVTRHEHVCGD